MELRGLARWNLLRLPTDERDISLNPDTHSGYRLEAENAVLNVSSDLWHAARCVHVAGEKNTRDRVAPTYHATAKFFIKLICVLLN